MPDLSPSLAGLSAAHQRRLNWAIQGVHEHLVAALLLDHSPEAAHLRALASDLAMLTARLIMQHADPTSNKRFTPWLVREYAARRLILEDLGSASDTLTQFQRYASRLKPEQRDIQRYDSLASAWQAVREFAERDEAQSNRAQKALDRSRAYTESRILRQDPDGFTVAVPMTEFAAKWWGRGTRWCTSAENNNQFWQYHQKAPLIVMTIPEVGKFQLWLGPDSFQFMDNSDHSVSQEFVASQWHVLAPLFRYAVNYCTDVLPLIPHRLRSFDLCLAAVKRDGRALAHVPNEYLDSYQLSLAAVTSNGRALEYVPLGLKTAKLCDLAVRNSFHALEYVPQDLLTDRLRRFSFVQHYSSIGLRQIPYKYRTPSLCLAAVRAFPRALRFVPKRCLTATLCLEAIKGSAWVTDLIPPALLTPDFCMKAVTINGFALEIVPPFLRSTEICHAAVTQNGEALGLLPLEQRSKELCFSALKQSPTARRFIPVHLLPGLLERLPPIPPSSSGFQAQLEALSEIFQVMPILDEPLCAPP